MAYADLDTIGGTSGSGILQDSAGYLVGVHAEGAIGGPFSCGPGDPNKGPSMDAIRAVSPVIRERALDPAKLSVLL